MIKETLIAITLRIAEKITSKFGFDSIRHDMENFSGVTAVRDLSLVSLRGKPSLVAHIVIGDLRHTEEIKTSLKAMLANRYNILHSTLEFETPGN
jgi:Co/Zn/Cd efflux system component